MANNCQVQTPREYVVAMLDYIGYQNELYGKKVLENSCGEGNILVEIVKRYIEAARKEGYSNNQIINGLGRDIYAYDIDINCIQKCREKLDEISNNYGLNNVKWKLINKDFLKSKEQKIYHFIIGNPPYVTYHDLTEEQRIFLKSKFKACQNGRFDYSYAFLEASINALKRKGKLVYLVPYSIMTNKFAKELRDILKPYINHIYDYKTIKIFPNALTSTVIFLCENRENRLSFIYESIAEKRIQRVEKMSLSEKWVISFDEDNPQKNKVSCFGDFFEISNSVATLCNEAFVLKNYQENKDYYVVQNYLIEKALVKEAASTKSYNKDKKKCIDRIIFPYKFDNNIFAYYSEEEFTRLYPKCSEYLCYHQEKLLRRKADKNAQWFEYGRSQAIKRVFGEKLIIPMVITKSVTVYKASKEAIPYAGYFIKRKEGCLLDLNDAKKILESRRFYEYVKICGTPTTPTSFRVSVNDIKNYTLDAGSGDLR